MRARILCYLGAPRPAGHGKAAGRPGERNAGVVAGINERFRRLMGRWLRARQGRFQLQLQLQLRLRRWLRRYERSTARYPVGSPSQPPGA